jgi:hypothetical protein
VQGALGTKVYVHEGNADDFEDKAQLGLLNGGGLYIKRTRLLAAIFEDLEQNDDDSDEQMHGFSPPSLWNIYIIWI